MRLVYISDSIIPSRNANSIHVMKMCRAFSGNGNDVTLLAPFIRRLEERGIHDEFSFYQVEKSFFIKKIPCPNVYGRPLIYGLFLVPWLVKRLKPDRVYGRSVFGCFSTAFLGIPTIYESHLPLSRQNRVARWFERRLFKYRQFVQLVVISDALKNIYKKELGKACPRIVVAHDGSDLQKTDRPQENWPGRSASLQVGYVGHLYRGRGVELILAVAKKMPDVDFHLMGGSQNDIKFWKDRNRSPNVFIHGFISPGAVSRYRKRCDVLLAPYQYQCSVAGGKGNTANFMSPLKIFEYMSSGTAMVVSDLPVLREMLDDSNCLLVPPDNIDAWVNAIGKLMDGEYRNRLAKAAFQDFKQRYTWHKRAKKVLLT